VKALAVAESQDKKNDYIGIDGFCVPKPYNKIDGGKEYTDPLPKEFD
jgi:hypothetical protein